MKKIRSFCKFVPSYGYDGQAMLKTGMCGAKMSVVRVPVLFRHDIILLQYVRTIRRFFCFFF